MSRIGYYKMQRGWLINKFFKPEKFTEREAWIWLIDAAMWADQVEGGVPLKRGQVGVNYRRLAADWRWSTDRVIRFLNRLEKEEMVVKIEIAKNKENMRPATQTRQFSRIISLCNYDKYQASQNRSRHKRDRKAMI